MRKATWKANNCGFLYKIKGTCDYSINTNYV